MFTTYGPPTQPTLEEEYILFVYPPKNSQAAPLAWINSQTQLEFIQHRAWRCKQIIVVVLFVTGKKMACTDL